MTRASRPRSGTAGGPTSFERSVAEVLDRLRSGEVITYGEVAAEAGYPGRARAVGAFLAAHGHLFPWWRVVTANGRLVPGNEQDHARRLRAEGIEVTDRTGRVRVR
jgi:methylated-DNA-protein-cysteine methyltransferase related protein